MLDRMREYFSTHPRAALVAGAGVLLVITVSVWRGFSPQSAPAQADIRMHYVDLETGEESIRGAYDVPPLAGKNGQPTVVRVKYYSCDGGATRQPYYYEKFSEEGKEAYLTLMKNPSRGADEKLLARMAEGRFLRGPGKDDPWVPSSDPTASAILGAPPCPPGATVQLMDP